MKANFTQITAKFAANYSAIYFFFLYSIEYEAPLKKIIEKEIIASARTRVCKPKRKINLKTIP